MAQTNENAFETYVAEILRSKSGWEYGSLGEWDKANAIFPAQLIAFIQGTQPDLYDDLAAQHGGEFEAKLLNALVSELGLKGTLNVLRHGFKFYGKTIRAAYFRPAHGMNPKIVELYARNRLTVTRQVPCHPNDSCTADIVFAVNGLPIATVELKNPGTGQTWKDAIDQYMKDRDPRAPLFSFKKRALVHFAADTDEVHMTTRLERDKTYFLPFNRGSHPGEIRCGKGNPQHPSGYRTGYFWEETLSRDSFMDILGSFMFLEKRDEKVEDPKGGHRIVTRETMVFPRFHQLEAVRRLVSAARAEGTGSNYLIQHSAGSGKTNSISWLSHRLASLHDDTDSKVFDCVIVVTDRQVLDRQLQDAIYQIEHAQGVVKPIDQDSRQLATVLIDGTKIVITTLQKFPFVLRGLLRVAGATSIDKPTEQERKRAQEWEEQIADRRYAVIVDEAHSSQSGETSRELKAILGASSSSGDDDESTPDWEDGLNRVMESRGRQPNVSFFAFTATPKGKTIEMFGRRGPSGKPEPFHVYSMRQAIEEGFILDVVRNYTTYATYYGLVKKIEDDPKVPKKKGARAIAKFMVLHPHNIEQRTEVIVEHFRAHVRPHLDGRAKAMVVTSSRLQAVRYMQSFTSYIAEHRYIDIRPLVAFSGTVKDPDTGFEYTEPGMNLDVVSGKPIGEKQLPERFASADYNILLVAEKYQTGFDQPLLVAMYVDKRLDGVQAVQTLSRLNRMIPGKETPFVLDFVNKSEDIYGAFKDYYDATSLQESSKPEQLEQIKFELDQMQVYHTSEIEAFAHIFYKSVADQEPADHARMQLHLQPAVDRFRQIEDEEKRAEFRDKLSGYVRIYAYLSQIMPYCDPDLEKLYSYGRFLLPHLPQDRDTSIVDLGSDVALYYYRLQRVFSGAIDLTEGDAEGVKSPTKVGTGQPNEEKAPLSEIIKILNDRFSTDFSEADRFFLEEVRECAASKERVIQTALANALDNYKLGVRKQIEECMIERMAKNDKIVTRYMDDPEFQNVIFPRLAEEIYRSIHARAEEKPDADPPAAI